jgi:hypothetical protein
MSAKGKMELEIRREARAERYRKRVAIQPDGMPSGKHLAGFKGTKVEGTCLCGGCNPKAKSNRGKVLVIGSP